MTDTDTTIVGEVAAAVRILRDISEMLRSIDTSPICHDPHDYGQPLNPREGTQQARGDTFAPDPPTREGDTVDAPQNAAREFRMGDRVVVSRDAKTVCGDDVYFGCETTGEITDGPDEDGDLKVEARDSAGLLKRQYVAPEWLTPAPAEEPEPAPVEWPTEPGLYWVRGVDAGYPVEGVAVLRDNGFQGAGTNFLIFKNLGDDRLDEAVPLTAVPTKLIEGLRAPNWCGQIASDASIEALLTWLGDHEDGAR
jgi:hypothetical protein